MMVKKPTTVRFSSATRLKLDALSQRYGTQSETLAVAIDRLYQAEVEAQIEEQPVSVLFADLRGFGAFSSARPPGQAFAVLDRYISLASETVIAEGGTLGSYAGDAVMAVFTASLFQPNYTLGAVQAALAIRRAAQTYNAAAGHEPLQFGMAVHVGTAVMGHVGPLGKKQRVAVGETVNLAYLLHARAVGGQVLLSPGAYDAVRDAVAVREGEPLVVRGRVAMEHTYTVTGLLQGAG